MQAAKQILKQFGVESIGDMEMNECYTIQSNGYMDLTMEKIGPDRISVAHYRLQRGDVMSDPEIVFDVTDSHWVPVRFTQHPYVHQFDDSGLDLGDFIDSWSDNLQSQGFTQRSSSTPEP